MAYVNMMPAELAAKYTREKLWPQKTVFDILAERVAAHPDRIAIKDQNGATTYGALKDRIERAAQFYRSIGVAAATPPSKSCIPSTAPPTTINRLSAGLASRKPRAMLA